MTETQQILQDLKAGAAFLRLTPDNQVTIKTLLKASGIPYHQFYIKIRKMKALKEHEALMSVQEVMATVGLHPRIFNEETDIDTETQPLQHDMTLVEERHVEEAGLTPPVSDQDAWNRVVSALVPLSPYHRSRVLASVQVYFDA